MQISPSRRIRALRRALAAAPCLCLCLAAPSAAEPAGEIRLAQAADAEAPDDERTREEIDAAAQESAGPPPGVEVMRVRGRGIGEVVTELPASVTSFDAATIEALGAQDVSDLARVTPNVNIVQPGATQANFFVRGIGLSDFSANSQGAVAVFQDDVALNAPAIQTGQLFDVQTVEIVRGPQGTGPFRNASAGAIRVLSNLPSGNYGARLLSSIGRYAADGGKGAHHGQIQNYEGYLEAPIVEDALSSRFAFRLLDAEPYKTNGCGNAPPFAARVPGSRGGDRPGNPAQLESLDICGERGRDVWPSTGAAGDKFSRVPPGLPWKVELQDQWAARGFLRFQPPETDLDVVLNAHGSRLDEDQTYGQAIGTRNATDPSRGTGYGALFGGATGGGGNNGYQEPDQLEELRERCFGVAPCNFTTPVVKAFEKRLAEGRPLDRRPYRGDYNKEGVTTRDAWGSYLRSTLKLGDLDLILLGSFDTYDRFRDQDTDFVPDILFENLEDDEAWQTYEEVRLGGELAATPFAWELGGYFLEESLESTSTTRIQGFNQFNQSTISRDYTQDTRSFGVWGEFAWDFLDELTLEGGVRLNWERKDFSLVRRTAVTTVVITQSASQDETWVTPTGNLVLTYHLTDRVSAFLKYARGFKAGHYNALASEEIDRPPADPEFNDAWEAGLSGAWLDGRLQAQANYFYYRYQDYQVFLFRDLANSPPVLEIVNAEEAENYGIEVEGRVEPLRGWAPRLLEGLMLTWNFGWLHGEYLDFQIRSIFQDQNLGGLVPITQDFSGERLQNSPEFKVSGSATWTFDLGRWGFLVPRYDVSWSDDVFYGVNEGRGSLDINGNQRVPDFTVGQPAFWLHNVRLAYRTPTANVEVAGWVRNLTDEVYKTFAFDASTFTGVVINFLGEPRTMGVDVTITF